jgi:hypothetical protein
MALAIRQTALADALVAEGPHPEHAEGLQLFGRFVGEFEGRAVQDVWIVPSRDRRGEPGLPVSEYGTTIRFFDPRLDVWLVTWCGPVNGARRIFVARRSGGDIVQEGLTEDGSPMRWLFSEIADDSFSWRSLVSDDGERTWQLREEMHVRRKAA